jgi:hypothetical protein
MSGRAKGSARIRQLALLAVAASVTAGCMDVTTDVFVRKDGSGTITETAYFSPMLMQMTQEMAQGMGEGSEGLPLFDPESLEEKAPVMGEGVSFVSSEEIAHEDGRKGYRVVYAFQDVSRLRLRGTPDSPAGPPGMPAPGMGVPGMTGTGGAPAPAEEEPPITFAFAPGSTPTLSVHLPRPEPPAEEPGPDESGPGPGGSPPEADEMLNEEMLKMVFGGFRVLMRIQVEGTIKETNATYVNEDRNGVTLVRMDLGQLLEDPEQLARLQSVGQVTDMETAKQVLEDFPGIEFETETEVTLKFK